MRAGRSAPASANTIVITTVTNASSGKLVIAVHGRGQPGGTREPVTGEAAQAVHAGATSTITDSRVELVLSGMRCRSISSMTSPFGLAVREQRRAPRRRSRGRPCGCAPTRQRATNAAPIAIAPNTTPSTIHTVSMPPLERGQPSRNDPTHDDADDRPAAASRTASTLRAICTMSAAIVRSTSASISLSSRPCVRSECATADWAHGIDPDAAFPTPCSARATWWSSRARRADLPALAGLAGHPPVAGRRVGVDVRARADRQGGRASPASRARATSASSSTPTPGSARRCWPGSTASRSASRPTTSLWRRRSDGPDRDEARAGRSSAGRRSAREIVPGETIPAATGLTGIAVSFTKGCYPGQELVERMDSRAAEAPRSLRRLEVAEGAAPGDPVLDDGELVGELTSVAGTHGARLREAHQRSSATPSRSDASRSSADRRRVALERGVVRAAVCELGRACRARGRRAPLLRGSARPRCRSAARDPQHRVGGVAHPRRRPRDQQSPASECGGGRSPRPRTRRPRGVPGGDEHLRRAPLAVRVARRQVDRAASRRSPASASSGRVGTAAPARRSLLSPASASRSARIDRSASSASPASDRPVGQLPRRRRRPAACKPSLDPTSPIAASARGGLREVACSSCDWPISRNAMKNTNPVWPVTAIDTATPIVMTRLAIAISRSAGRRSTASSPVCAM